MNSNQTTSTSPIRYTTHLYYRLLAGAAVLLGLLFAWELRYAWEVGTVFFLALMGVLAVRLAQVAGSRVEVTGESVQLVTPGRPRRTVAYRQLADVYEEGRGFKAILLIYHPRRDDGLLDLDDVDSLTLPAVGDHAELLAELSDRVPA